MHPTTLAVLSLPFALALCDPAAIVEGAACQGRSDCPTDYICAGPDDPGVCGIPPLEACANAAECGEDISCHAIPDSCSPDGVGSECGEDCTEDSCADGFTCSGGACRAILCTEGFVCPDHQTCDTAGITDDMVVHERTHGCVDVTCASTADCGSGHSCVNGICQSGPGVCQPDQPVP